MPSVWVELGRGDIGETRLTRTMRARVFGGLAAGFAAASLGETLKRGERERERERQGEKRNAVAVARAVLSRGGECERTYPETCTG